MVETIVVREVSTETSATRPWRSSPARRSTSVRCSGVGALVIESGGPRASPRPPRSRRGPRSSPRPPRLRRGPRSSPRPPRSRDAPAALDIEVQRELPRVRTEPHRVHLVLALVVDPRFDHVRREDVALQQPVVGFLEVVEHDAEVAGKLLDLLRLGRWQLV